MYTITSFQLKVNKKLNTQTEGMKNIHSYIKLDFYNSFFQLKDLFHEISSLFKVANVETNIFLNIFFSPPSFDVGSLLCSDRFFSG